MHCNYTTQHWLCLLSSMSLQCVWIPWSECLLILGIKLRKALIGTCYLLADGKSIERKNEYNNFLMCFKTCTESWHNWLLWILQTSSFSIFDTKLKGITHCSLQWTTNTWVGFPGGSVVKNTLANAVEAGSISGSGRSPGEGNGNPL